MEKNEEARLVQFFLANLLVSNKKKRTNLKEENLLF